VLAKHFAVDMMLAYEGETPLCVELGSGEGNQTAYLLQAVRDANIVAVDPSDHMQHRLETKLGQYINRRLRPLCVDANTFLVKTKSHYDAVIAAWTIHNFPWKDKEETFRQAFRVLQPGAGLYLFDKVYPDSVREARRLQNRQLARYRWLPEHVRTAMVKHEEQDFTPEYRMSETQTLEALASAGFECVQVIDRVERDVVIVGYKPGA
jgi:ubiquinone/menaquinone biosynthesis C-methylase UbiE